ncbi:structural protein P4 [Raspberry latent virus]|uniref:structural protein P4 n=1 Tax=Raspberry latent virus TaxID=907191 RepID=UPI0001E6901B|nr:structural protein P4 [Raspberry latent virus]ADO27690.1 structural protein P4 [Raspberry latent virus]
MEYNAPKFLIDQRLLKDPHPNQVSQLLKNPIQYDYSYHEITNQHSLRLRGIWGGYYPTTLDLRSNLFETLRSENSEIPRERMIQMLRELQLSIKLPLPKIKDASFSSMKYCYLLGWIARAFEYHGPVWGRIGSDPTIVCYRTASNVHPLQRFMELCDREASSVQLYGCRAYYLPGEQSPDLAQYQSINQVMADRYVAWMHPEDWRRNFSYLHVPPTALCAIHHTWMYDLPHMTFFSNRIKMVEYLLVKVSENHKCFRKFNDGQGEEIDRVSEAVGTFRKNDTPFLILHLLQNDQLLADSFLQNYPKITADEFLQMWPQFGIDTSKRKIEPHFIQITSTMKRCIAQSRRAHWCYESLLNDEEVIPILDGIPTVGGAVVSDDLVIWSDIPLGPPLQLLSGRTFSAHEPLSSLLYTMSTVPSQSGQIHLQVGRGICELPTLANRQRSENEIASARNTFLTPLPDVIWQLLQTGRINPMMFHAVKKMRQQFTNGGFGRVEVYSTLHLLQNLLFDDPDLTFGEVIPKPSVKAKPTRLNQNSLKLMSVFAYICRSILDLNQDHFDLTQQDKIPIVSKIVIAGAVDDPFASCLRKTYPNINVIGFGTDAVSPNLRMSVEGASSRNMSCNILISEIGQENKGTFEQMIEGVCEHVVAFVSWASLGAIRLSYPSTFLFNSIRERLDAMDQNVHVFPFQVTYQDLFTPDCYLMFHRTNRFRNGTTAKYFDNSINMFEKKHSNLYKPSNDYVLCKPVRMSTVFTKRQLDLDTVPNCGYFALTTPWGNAAEVVNLLLESCEQVSTWKGERSGTLVNVVGRISKFRMALTQRNSADLGLTDGARMLSYNSFGVSNRRMEFSSLLSIPWYTIVAEASRLMMVDIIEKVLPNVITQYCAIGSRNLTECYAVRKYPLRCFDEYYANGPQIQEAYGIEYLQRAYRYGEEALLAGEAVMANFSLMSSLQPDVTTQDAEADDQYNKILGMINSIKTRNDPTACFIASVYVNGLRNELDYGSDNLPLGMTFTAPNKLTFGGYVPVSTIDMDALVDTLREDCEFVRYAMVSLDWILKACNTHGWVPSASGSSAIATVERVVMILIISSDFPNTPEAKRRNLVMPLPGSERFARAVDPPPPADQLLYRAVNVPAPPEIIQPVINTTIRNPENPNPESSSSNERPKRSLGLAFHPSVQLRNEHELRSSEV